MSILHVTATFFAGVFIGSTVCCYFFFVRWAGDKYEQKYYHVPGEPEYQSSDQPSE